MKITEGAGKDPELIWRLCYIRKKGDMFEDVIEKLQVNPRHRKEKEALICSAN